MSIIKAIFPVAGFGTRMLPSTKSIPKDMLTLIDKPIIHYSVQEAVESGLKHIFFITGSNKKALEDYFDTNLELEIILEKSGKIDLLEMIRKISNMCDVIYIRQKEQKGLGHAVYCARDFVQDEAFAVLLPDDIIISDVPVIKQLMNVYNKVKAPVLGLMEVPVEEVSKYGVVKIEKKIDDRLFKLNDMVEKPEKNPPSQYAIVGRYILTDRIMKNLGKISEGALGEIQLTDAVREEAKNGEVYGYIFEGRRFDCGTKLSYLEAIINIAFENPELRAKILEIMEGLNKQNER
jgi:UTP--glucose-1-phosphate uridylyltransferase